jgi:DNA polymerase I-like protein with 3'-5' exonuclease and polymerase domains
MCIISEYLQSEAPESRLLLNIHDEYSMSMARGKKSIKHLQELRRLIEDKPMLRVPIRIDFSQPSANWWDATSAPKCT